MAMPKSVTKVSRDGKFKFVSNVNAVEYSIRELTRGALRDCGKLLRTRFIDAFYASHKKRTGNVRKGTGYWVRKRECDMQIGIGRKGVGFYGGFQETGAKGQSKEGLLRQTVENSVPDLEKIQGQYLSRLNNEKPNLGGINEEDMKSD